MTKAPRVRTSICGHRISVQRLKTATCLSFHRYLLKRLCQRKMASRIRSAAMERQKFQTELASKIAKGKIMDVASLRTTAQTVVAKLARRNKKKFCTNLT